MDTYDGHVEPDGPWVERIDGAVLIRKLSVEAMDNNVYVVADHASGDALLIDAAARPERLRDATRDVSLRAIVQTHGHWDHVRALAELQADAPVWAHAADAPLLPVRLDRALTGGQRLTIGQVAVEVLHVPGHTPGSLLFLVHGAARPHLFTGDTLFPGGHGKTATLDDHHLIMDGLERDVFGRLPDATWIYPGHGDDTTLGAERPHLAAWRDRGW